MDHWASWLFFIPRSISSLYLLSTMTVRRPVFPISSPCESCFVVCCDEILTPNSLAVFAGPVSPEPSTRIINIQAPKESNHAIKLFPFFEYIPNQLDPPSSNRTKRIATIAIKSKCTTTSLTIICAVRPPPSSLFGMRPDQLDDASSS